MKRLNSTLISLLVGTPMACATAHAASHLPLAVALHAIGAAAQRDAATLTVAERGSPPPEGLCKQAMDWTLVSQCLPYRRRELFAKPTGLPEKVAGRGGPPLLKSLPLSLEPTPAEEAEFGKAFTIRQLENDQKLDYDRRLNEILRTQ